MSRSRLLAMVLLAAVVIPTAASAREFKPPSLLEAIAGTGFSIPAAWSGVWQYQDSTYQCTPRTLTDTDSGLDTLCAGTSFEPDTTEGVQYDCTGTVSDTFVDITCTGSLTFEDCTGTFQTRSVGTRTGESYIATTTVTLTWSPAFCALQADSCTEIVTRATRISPQPGGCTTAAIQGTWGSLKTRYR